METGCWCWVPGAGAGASAVSWLCTWWRQVAGAGAGCRVPVHGAGAVSWLCTGCCELAVRVVETGRRRWVQQLCQGLYCLCAYFCTSQRQALNQPLFQHVSACYTRTHTIVALDTAWPWASETHGLASCAHTFVRILIYAQDHTALSFYSPQASWPSKFVSYTRYRHLGKWQVLARDPDLWHGLLDDFCMFCGYG